ncbi:Norsolorinic acid ketoreductase [Cytospora mali]|nr:Norsolorinic acid ketoreductase [Valsa mali]
MSSTIVLITGANRGIGRGLLESYLLRPNHTVIAANRDPNHPTSKSLYDLPRADGTTLLLVQIDATVPDHPAKAVQTLQSHGISHIDILIANAGVAYLWPKVRDVKTEDMKKHMVPNVYGVVWLFQAMLPLLKRTKAPKWVTIGSSAGFLSHMLPVQNAAYAPSKLVGHWLTKAISIEEPWLTAFPIDPGWVKTDLGNRGAEALGKKEATVALEDSVAGLMKVIDAASKETHSGRLWVYTGEEVSAW